MHAKAALRRKQSCWQSILPPEAFAVRVFAFDQREETRMDELKAA